MEQNTKAVMRTNKKLIYMQQKRVCACQDLPHGLAHSQWPLFVHEQFRLPAAADQAARPLCSLTFLGGEAPLCSLPGPPTQRHR